MNTFMAKPAEIEKKWYVIDAAGRPLGRTATEAARILRGKHKPIFTPHVDTGDFVIIINSYRKQAKCKEVLSPLGLSGWSKGNDL